MSDPLDIRFDTVPDCAGMGRVIVNGKFYGLPIAAIFVLNSAVQQATRITELEARVKALEENTVKAVKVDPWD